MTDRHQELRRQHELLRQHLAWLEREMARETAADKSPATVPAMVQAQTPAVPAEDTDALLNTYAADERHNPESTKRGCLLIFAATLGLLIAGVTTVYFLFYFRR